MKLDHIDGDQVWALKLHELGNEALLGRLADRAELGDMVTVDVPPAEPPTPDRLEARKPKPFAKPSLDGLRLALRARGRELELAGPFFYRVVER